ncbi:MAG: rod shape-determining protein MreC, partial [Ostreibacterium sp.]
MVKKTGSLTGTSLIALTILLLTVSVVMMVLDYQGKILSVRNIIQQNFSIPLKIASTWPADLGQNISDYFSNKKNLLAGNNKLKQEVTWLKANLANQTVLEAENRRLKSLFQSTANQLRPVMIAELLDSQIDAKKHQIEINKGADDKVFKEQIVINDNAVVGQDTAST